MLEALIAALLLAVLFVGINYALSRGLVSQRFAATQSLAVLDMRNNLQQTDKGVAKLCDDATPDNLGGWSGSVGVSAECNTTTITVEIPGFERTVTIPQLSLETESTPESEELFGGDGKIRISNQ